jgi:hypothetical protein
MGEQVPLMVLPEHVLNAPRQARVKKHGHAAPPGTGPAGEACGSCQHRERVRGGNKTFSKCALAKARWTCGPGSDIRIKDAACRLWTRKETKT